MMSVPVDTLKSSIARWLALPLPAVPYVRVPGFDFASEMNSFTDRAGTLGWMTSRFGSTAIRVTGAKSFTVSYGSFLWRYGLAPCAMFAVMMVYPSGADWARSSDPMIAVAP